ncbi:MAG: C-GCAxxG-C-C family protein [Thermodesulfobacteriota bacterium]
MDDPIEAIIQGIYNRADNLYRTHQMFCAEAVLASLNNGLGGGLTEKQAVSLAAGLTVGIGGSGCMCGALGGGVLALGLFLGENAPYRNRKAIREASGELHERFKSVYKSTCCRTLSKHVKDNAKAHFDHCAGITAAGAEMTARLILEKRPELALRSNMSYLKRRQSKIAAFIMNIANFFR